MGPVLVALRGKIQASGSDTEEQEKAEVGEGEGETIISPQGAKIRSVKQFGIGVVTGSYQHGMEHDETEGKLLGEAESEFDTLIDPLIDTLDESDGLAVGVLLMDCEIVGVTELCKHVDIIG